MEHVSSVRPTGKFPEKVENLKRLPHFLGWNFRTECRVPFTFLVVRYQFQVHGRAPLRTGVYDQMEQLFTNRKFHFCSHRNFWVFFLNGKRPPTTSFLDFSSRDRLSCAAGFGLYSETPECLCFSRCLATLGLPRMPEVFNFSSFLIVCGDAATKTVRTGYFILGFSRTDPWIQGTLGFAL